MNNLNEIKHLLNMTTGCKVVGYTNLKPFGKMYQENAFVTIDDGELETSLTEFKKSSTMLVLVKNMRTQQLHEVAVKIILDYSNVGVSYQILSVDCFDVNEKETDLTGKFLTMTEPTHPYYNVIKTVGEALTEYDYKLDKFFMEYIDTDSKYYQLIGEYVEIENFEE